MPPTESQILTQTLLPPSSLPTILPLAKFTSLFPSSLRTSPHIPILYRALQLQRSLDLDAIRENIQAEARAGREQMRAFARSRARDVRASGATTSTAAAAAAAAMDEGEGEAVDLDLNQAVLRTSRRKKQHTSKSLCEGLEEAEAEIRAEIAVLEQQARLLVQECEGLVDELGVLEMSGVVQAGVDVQALMEGLGRVRDRDGVVGG